MIGVTPAANPPNVLYVGNFCFPDGDAGGSRVQAVGKALRDGGYEVAFVGSEPEGRAEDRQPDGGYRYQGLAYVPENRENTARPTLIMRGLMGTTIMRRIDAMDVSATKIVIAYHGSSPLLYRLESFCRRRRIALVADCTEWYDPWHLPGGPIGPFYLNSEVRMRWLQPRIGRAITVSAYLERYYRERGCAVLRVPPLVDMGVGYVAPPHREDRVLRLVYSGSPGKKDLLGNAILGLRDVKASGAMVQLHLVGVARDAAAGCVAGGARLLDELGDAVVCHGRVGRGEALKLVAQAHFSTLLRPDKRYAHAGFPTKLVESLSLGVPILTNITSDIGEYVRDGKEGVIVDDGSPEAFASAVFRVLRMPHEQWHAMRVHARQRACDSFDYRHYVGPLKTFLEEAMVTCG